VGEHVFVHSIERVEEALKLDRLGLNPYAISRRTGIARSTLLHWLENPDRALGNRGRRAAPGPAQAPATYAYLLGLYLGDGWMRRYPRTWQLVVTLDSRYERIVRAAQEAIATFTPSGIARSRPRRDSRAVDVSAYGQHWPILLPQHGPGRKHHRTIALTGWQRELTRAFPKPLLRGLIHSDGCRVVAKIRGSHGRRYSYARYYFSNRSEDIRGILCEHLDLVGVDWTRSTPYTIQIARRRAVAVLDAFIGPKR
jgi:hypothetical protein